MKESNWLRPDKKLKPKRREKREERREKREERSFCISNSRK